MAFDLPVEVVGLQLCKVFAGDVGLRVCEPIRFADGAPAVDTVLRRAQIAGDVGPVGSNVELQDYWADLLDANGDIVSHACLDANSFRALKRYWLRVPYEKAPQ